MVISYGCDAKQRRPKVIRREQEDLGQPSCTFPVILMMAQPCSYLMFLAFIHFRRKKEKAINYVLCLTCSWVSFVFCTLKDDGVEAGTVTWQVKP